MDDLEDIDPLVCALGQMRADADAFIDEFVRALSRLEARRGEPTVRPMTEAEQHQKPGNYAERCNKRPLSFDWDDQW